MKKMQFTVILFFIMTNLFGQVQKPIYNNVAREFVNHYNSASYDSIFLLFSEDTKSKLPLNKTNEFFEKLNSQVGKIKQLQFKTFDEKVATYKARFEKAVLAVNISLNDSLKINEFTFKPYTEDSLPKMERTVSKLMLPFKGEWTVTHGGDTRELNHHVVSQAQKNAFDIKITNEKGNSYKTDGETNEDYYAFEKDLIAPSDGEVVLVVDGIKDNKPGSLNPIFVYGNTVIIKTVNNEFLVLAHFKQHSIKVKQGQKIKQGQFLGLTGNSGNSSEPHLHFHVQNVEDINVATGVKAYFDKIIVNGELKKDYSPIRGDKVKNADN